MESLRAIWVQQYYRDPAGLRWRTSEIHGRPPGAMAITSPYDVDARYSVKRGAGWNGYKVQICESCDDNLPRDVVRVQCSGRKRCRWVAGRPHCVRLSRGSTLEV